MTRLRIEGGLPFIEVTLRYRGKSLRLKNVLVDTGSAGSLFSADRVAEIGIQLEAHDTLQRIAGVGGSEFVFTKHIESLALGDMCCENMEIEVGAMDYGFPIEGILGSDFLLAVGALIDMNTLEIRLAV